MDFLLLISNAQTEFSFKRQLQTGPMRLLAPLLKWSAGLFLYARPSACALIVQPHEGVCRGLGVCCALWLFVVGWDWFGGLV